MELTIAIVMSIIGCVMSVSSFVLNRKDKATKDTGDEQYKMGILEEKINAISKQLDKVLDKLDTYDKEIDERIDKAMQHHIKEMHNK